MTLPFTFADATGDLALSDFDANFAAVGALVTIPCTITGVNTLILTPAVGSPAIPNYANYLRVCGVPVDTNTAAAAARVGPLALLQIYLDSPTGPRPLIGYEIVAGNLITLVYDSALDGGSGGWHLL